VAAAGFELLGQTGSQKAGVALRLALGLTGDAWVGGAKAGQLELTAVEVQTGSLWVGRCGHQDTARSWS
jgi:hypothetical protein